MTDAFTNMRSLNGIMMDALNLFDPDMKAHHEQAAYLALMIARDLDLDSITQQNVMFCAMAHDIGRVMMDESGKPAEAEKSAKEIARMGAKLTSKFVHPDPLPDIIRQSQNSWTEYLELTEAKKEALFQSARLASIVHLVDTVSTMIHRDALILNQAKHIREAVGRLRGTEFSEEAVGAFLRVTRNERVWLDMSYYPELVGDASGESLQIPLRVAVALTKDTSLIVDYRSAFTATHSAGVAASATALARYAGMSEAECRMMQIAGNLHDIGKLKIPRSILEKPARLTAEEYSIIKEHPYFTYRILKKADGFETIARWAGFHHEKLNGKGYPFRYGADMLDTGSRIMAVADIFAAITEVRPYRMGMDREHTLEILQENVRSGGIDSDLVALLSEHYEEIDCLRETAARTEGARYYVSTTREELEKLRETAARAESAGFDGFITKEDIENLRRESFASYEGAMDVDYGQFARQYHYISNLEKRFAHPFTLLVISMNAPTGDLLQSEELERDMLCMEQVIRLTVRNVDVMTRYGSQQFLVILLGTDSEGAKIAADRIYADYRRMNSGSVSTPSYYIAETERGHSAAKKRGGN